MAAMSLTGVTVELDGGNVHLRLLQNGQMHIGGTLRVKVGYVVDSVDIQAELIAHHFYYAAATGEGRVQQSPFGTVSLATLDNGLQNNTEVELPLATTMPLPETYGIRSRTWELRIYAIIGAAPISTRPISVWLGQPSRPHPWEGFLLDETVSCIELAPSVNLYHLVGHLPEGPIDMRLLVANLTDPRVHADALLADQPFPVESARWPRSVVSHMVSQAQGIAGINASLFEINATMNPRGMSVQSGKLLKSGNPNWQSSFGLTAGSVPYFGSWQLRGGIRKLDGSGYRAIATFSTSGTGADHLGLFGWPWTQSSGYDPEANGANLVVEVVLTHGVERGQADMPVPEGLPSTALSTVAQVAEVRLCQPGTPIQRGMFVVTGFGDAANYLLNTYKPGDQVELLQAVMGETAWPGFPDWQQLNAVVSGNMFLLLHAGYGDPRVLRLPERHPHTAIATTCDQSTLYWLIVDGRSEQSIGMTYKELADFFLYIGAFHALNCDGGGSTTLAIRDPETLQVKVVNTPSDGEQRPVPDGLVIRWDEGGR